MVRLATPLVRFDLQNHTGRVHELLVCEDNGPVKAGGCIHSRTYPEVSLSVACENSTTGGFDIIVETSTGLHTNWLLALVGPLPLMAGAG